MANEWNGWGAERPPDADDRSDEVRQEFAEAQTQFGDPTEAAVAQSEVPVADGKPYPTQDHHPYPQQFRGRFEGLGLDIDQVTYSLDAEGHQKVVHAHDKWDTHSNNPEWKSFFAEADGAGREVTQAEAVAFGQQLSEANGWDHREAHAYRKPDELTSVSDLYLNSPPPPEKPPEAGD